MESIFDLTQALTALPSVSGFEKKSAARLEQLAREYTGIQFDISETAPSGSLLVGIKARESGAKTLVLDAHFDTVGFIVTEHCKNGFVRLTNIGGIDAGILHAAEIELYGKETLRAFFVSTPPHLSKNAGAASVSDILADTGLSDEMLKELCPLGTPAGFRRVCSRLQNGRIASPSLDDKACIAVILETLRRLDARHTQNLNVCAHFSSGEEKSGFGASTFAYNFKADACVILDVNFAKEKDSKNGEYIEFDRGGGVSISSTTSRPLTDALISSANKHSHPFSRIVEMTNTGTNAQILARKGGGTPCAVFSVPLRYMHTSVECVSEADMISCAETLSDFILDLNADFPCEPVYLVRGGKSVE